VTLHSLSQHSGGVSRELPATFSNLTDEQVLFWVNQMPLIYPPYSTSRYSNLGVAFVGQTVARAANTTYEQWMQDNVFDPIGMSSSGFSFPADIVARMPRMSTSLTPTPNNRNNSIKMLVLMQSRCTAGYTLVNNQQVAITAYAEPLYFGAPMGGMRSTAKDMAAFIKFIFAAQHNADDSTCPRSPTATLPASAKRKAKLDTAAAPCIMTRSRWIEWMQGGALQRNGISNYGLGTFEQAYTNNFWAQTKGGLLAGYGSSLAMVPELQLGAFAAFNMNSGTVGQV
jgi:CubicO group peptidase (beta-lactamase class C family)